MNNTQKNIYLGVKDGFIRKFIYADNKSDANKQLDGFKVIKLSKNMSFYITKMINDDNEIQPLYCGKFAIKFVCTPPNNIHRHWLRQEIIDGKVYLYINSLVYETPKFNLTYGFIETSVNCRKHYYERFEIGKDYEGKWKILIAYKKYDVFNL